MFFWHYVYKLLFNGILPLICRYSTTYSNCKWSFDGCIGKQYSRLYKFGSTDQTFITMKNSQVFGSYIQISIFYMKLFPVSSKSY